MILGIGNYINLSNTASALGYGAAGTYFIWKDLQVKLSYEKAFRLPTTDELFGDEDLEAGKIGTCRSISKSACHIGQIDIIAYSIRILRYRSLVVLPIVFGKC